MSDLRHDPINDVWITVAGNRRTRPMEFVPLEQVRQQIICPFCKGNETETPVAKVAYRADGRKLTENDDPSQWLTRVVVNKFPSYSTPEGNNGHPQLPKSEPLSDASSPFRVDNAHGIQELIIPTSRHVSSVSELTQQELELSFMAHRDRIETLRTKSSVRHAMLFLNCRSAAGASLGHLHWQLIGSPMVSGHLRRRTERENEHLKATGRTLSQTLTDWEIQQGTRILRLTDHFAIYCPFASKFPFQIRIAPRRQGVNLVDASDEIRNELAAHCHEAVEHLETLLDNPAYNILVNMPPFSDSPSRQLNSPWAMDIFPRLTKPAGFEWGTDIWVNPVAPEMAARAIRVALEDDAAN